MPRPRTQEHDYTKAKPNGKTLLIKCSNCSFPCGEKDFVQHVLVEGLKNEKSKATVLNGLSAICGIKLSPEFLNTNAEKVILCKKCGILFANLYKFYIQFTRASANDSFVKNLISGKVVQDKFSGSRHNQGSSMWDTSEDEFEKAIAPPPKKRATGLGRLRAKDQEPEIVEIVEEIHDPTKPKTYKCNECGSLFGDVWEWLSHIETHPVGLDLIKKPKGQHRPRAKSLCTLCGKLFTCLETHMQGSHAEKEYQCHTCNKAFSFQRQLERHIQQVHLTGKEVFPCRHCGKLYQDKRYLLSHERSHDANYIVDKPFKCGECDASFQFKAGLTLHSVKHVRNKAFSCTLCYRKFAQKALLNNHLEYHKRQEQLTTDQCIFCGRGYTVRQRLRDHLVANHGMAMTDATELAGVEAKKRIRSKVSPATSARRKAARQKAQEYSDSEPKPSSDYEFEQLLGE